MVKKWILPADCFFKSYVKSIEKLEFFEMENIYNVVEIKEKGLGCVALKDIKKGTLILKEKPQCVAVTSGHSGLKIEKKCNKELLDKCELGNKIASLRHKCHAK